MRKIITVLIICFLIIISSFHPLSKKEYELKKIVIDAGHGGKDPGTRGKKFIEKKIALNIALKLEQILKENLKGVEIHMTRRTDKFIPLDERANIANRLDADLFVSIHVNWISNPKIKGTETYVLGVNNSEENFEVAKRENEVILLEEDDKKKYQGFNPSSPESYILFSLYQNAYQKNSLLLAQKIEREFKHRVGRESRGVKTNGFVVLFNTYMPSVLIETGFLSNAQEEAELNDDLIQTYLASGIFRAIRDYKTEIESN